MSAFTTEKVISATGRLDRIISELVLLAKEGDPLLVCDEADWQTLKHHAEDMSAASELILRRFEGR